MIKYRTRLSRSFPEIHRVEVAKETKATVTLLNGRKVSKLTEYESYFDSYSEAKEYLIEYFTEDISRLKRKISDIEHALLLVVELEEPE